MTKSFMNILNEGFCSMLRESDSEWKELPTFKDVKEFGEGTHWVTSSPKGEQYYKEYTKNGDVFVGKGTGDKRVLALKGKDGKIFNKFDVKDNLIKEELLDESRVQDEAFKAIFGEEMLERFKALKQRLQSPNNDITYWIGKGNNDAESAIEELEGVLTELENTRTRRQRRADASEGAELLLDDGTWKVYHITTYEAAKTYGSHTKWCITGRYPGYEGRGEFFFKDYLDRHYTGYYFFILDNEHKWCVCPFKDSDRVDIWFGASDEKVSHIPNAPQVPGLPDVSGPVDDDEDLDELDFDGEEEEQVDAEEEPNEPEQQHNEIIIPVEHPEQMEFPAGSVEEAASMFNNSEVVGTIREPDLYVVKWHVEADANIEGDTGDRFAPFAFFRGQGGGPLMAQQENGFCIVAFKTLEEMNEFSRRVLGGVQIQVNGQNNEELIGEEFCEGCCDEDVCPECGKNPCECDEDISNDTFLKEYLDETDEVVIDGWEDEFEPESRPFFYFVR